MSQCERAVITGKNGLRGTAELTHGKLPDGGQIQIDLEDGGSVLVPAELLVSRGDGRYDLPLGPDELDRGSGGTVIIPLAREELHVGRRRVETGRVVVRKTLREREEVVDLPLLKEEVEVERVPVSRVVSGPVSIRNEGDMVVVPLVEEVLVVEKRLVLREELRIRRRRTETRHSQKIELRSEEAAVERIPSPCGESPAAQ